MTYKIGIKTIRDFITIAQICVSSALNNTQLKIFPLILLP